ncbi:MAG TPA: hypothetical protein PLZ36_01900 [Armatimonadota bacterium]|nr:hypothetical protein [Armatimonadota bacterium]
MAELRAYLTDTAMLHRRTGVSAYGEDLLDTGREIRCRVRRRRLQVVLDDGEAQRYPGEVWLEPDATIAPGDRLLYDGDYLRVCAVEQIVDVAGISVGLRAVVD